MSTTVINHVPGMIAHANQTVTRFGLDNTDTIQYQFNSQGFRSSQDYTSVPEYAFFGCSSVFGIGVNHDQVFANMFSNSHNYGLAGDYNNNDIFVTVEAFLNRNDQLVKKFVCWTDRDEENLRDHSAELSRHGFVQFFCGRPQPYENCFAMPPKFDLDVSGTHMGPKTHQITHNILCKLFDQ